MKEDYLWDKTGSDPEIERLENALAMFRYQAIDAPELPAKIVPFERKTPRSFLRLIFAFAASAAVVAICFGVWLQTSGNKIEVAKDLPQAIAPQINEKAANTIAIKSPDHSIVKTVESSKPAIERKVIKVRSINSPVAPQNKTIAKNVETKKPAVKLTKDEKYAYNQLMLALSITSSKFKLVKDKVDGTEE